jgi:hypothetical protein
MAYVKNNLGTLETNTEYSEGFELVPGVGYIVCKVIDEQIHYYGAETDAMELVIAFGGDETVGDAVAWLKTNVGPVFQDGVEL